jgi:hypothetical protein
MSNSTRKRSLNLGDFRLRYVSLASFINAAVSAETKLQIDGLRSSIPSIVSPLTRRGTDNTQRFAQIRSAAVGSTADLQAFKQVWKSDETQKLLARSKESLQKDSDLSKAVNVPMWGWGEERDT